MKSKLILRFDIDTLTCIKSGVPSLLRFAEHNQVPISFFANVGRAVSWAGVLQSRLSLNVNETRKTVSLGARRKLGWKDLLRTVFLDPEIGLLGASELRLIEKEGHDLGLHGGRNHSAWHHLASNWALDRLRLEIDWGLERMSSIGLSRPNMFASPGFTHPVDLPIVLNELGFKLFADDHGWGLPAISGDRVGNDILSVTTGLLGEPGGVGFVENLVAKGESEAAVRGVVKSFVNTNQTFVMYDHPCFAGGEGKPMLQTIVNCWKREGGQFCSLSDLYR